MPNLPISQLPQSTALQGGELFVNVQGGTTKYTTLNSISAYATSSIQNEIDSLTSVTSSYLTSHQNTGSLMITGSLSGTTLTFTKGDSSNFNIDLSSSLVESAFLSIYSSASQALAVSGAAQPVTFTSTWTSNGISLEEGSKIRMTKAGTYQFNFIAQIENPDNATYDAWFWIKYNGNNFPNSSTQMTMRPRKSSGQPSAALMSMNIVGVAQNDNDYIQLYWTGENTSLTIKETPATPVIPETPSIIASIIRVG